MKMTTKVRTSRPDSTNGAYREEPVDHRLTDREWADEWRHLDHVLNCIVDMVEKTRRSVAVLRRCQESDREELNYWRRRSSEQETPGKEAPEQPRSPKHTAPHRLW
uniref:NHR2-like domain-containing protein n=1 Tax=Neogobius melanostomus TaxID=47308 RepID=A0A8C6SNQ8_9GOBI